MECNLFCLLKTPGEVRMITSIRIKHLRDLHRVMRLKAFEREKVKILEKLA